MRMLSMKLSEAIKIVKPTYKYFKITPNNSIRNQSTYKVARSISTLYKNMFQRISMDVKKLPIKIQISEKISYFIYIEKEKVEFYFIIPDIYETLIMDKVSESWQSITIKEVDKLPKFIDPIKYHLQYEKEDALSLNVDRRNNDLLRANLNIINTLEKDEKLGIFYNFIPSTQYTWRNEHKNTIDKVKSKLPVDRDKSKTSFILKYSLSMLTNFINDILMSFTDKKEKDQTNTFEFLLEKMNGNTNISKPTINKKDNVIIDTQILILSESKDKMKSNNNAKALAQSFETISEDNRLIPKKYKKDFNYNDYKLKAPINKLSDVECQNFLCLAGRDILEEYNFIDKIETKETQVPDELRKGKWRLGESIYRGNKQPAFLTEHEEYKNLSLFLIGPSRAGKTTLIGNMSYDAIKNDECVILFDFIENCEMSTQVAKLFPDDKVLNIVCNSKESAQGLGYNEIRFSTDSEQQYINAKTQTTQLSTLINSVNTDDAPLTARMRRYLTGASLVVFLAGGSIKDVFTVLQNNNVRHNYINKVDEAQLDNMQEYLDYLYELDERDKEGIIVGTKISSVEGIISRLNILKDNPYMEMMLKKNTDHNIDLVTEMEKNQLINIKMPEHMFNTDEERDVYCIYWITKVWLALQVRATLIPDRDKRRKVNLFVDEMYQVQNTEKFMSEKLSRFAKFRLKPVVSCHYLGQLKYMKKELAGANASYMMIAGCDKDNFMELQNELKPFVPEDLLKLKEHHSMNLIKMKGGYGKFITKLPEPISEKY